MDLTLAWAAIIALGLLIYVVLDGFDLGIGILFPLFPEARDRDVMMNTVAPVWDGNETWLVLGGAGLFAAFPMIYSTVLSGLYLPLVFMLACLIFRGVSFEIRSKATRTKPMWDLAFIGGSAGATFFQGVTLGALADAVQPLHGNRARGHLCIARLLLADRQDRRRVAAAPVPDRVAADVMAAGGNRGGEHLDAAPGRHDRRALVRYGVVLPLPAGPGAGRGMRLVHAPGDPFAP
jgi:hypothetical protein